MNIDFRTSVYLDMQLDMQQGRGVGAGLGEATTGPRRPSTVLVVVVCSLLLSFSLYCRSAQVDWLYEAEVPVQDQDAAHRNLGIDQAFAKVLIRVTGNRSVLRHPQLADSLKHGDRYVQQYRYRISPPKAEGGTGENPQRWLSVSFDPAAVNGLLRSKGLPVWGGNRPAILVWLGLEEQGRRRLAAPERDETLREALEKVGRARGAPLLFPLMDLEDRSRLQVSDLWGDFESRIRQASERYVPDAIVTGRLRRRGGLWHAHWVLIHGERTATWDSSGKTRETAASEGLEHAIDRLAAKYVPLVGDTSVTRLRLRVEDIDDLAAYGRVSRYLTSLDGVERVALVSAEPAASTFDLQVRGGAASLEQGIALGGILEPIPGLSPSTVALPAPGSTAMIPVESRGPTLEYRLRR